MKLKTIKEKRRRRHRRVRVKIKGTADVPRLCVFKSLKYIYAQLIDDDKGIVLSSANSRKIKEVKVKTEKDEKSLKGKMLIAYKVGKLIAQKAQEKKIKKIVFDRGGYKYHGRVRCLAEGAREQGLDF